MKQKRFSFIHKLSAGTSLVAFIVVVLGGIMAGARVITIAYRAFLVMLIIGLVSRIVIRVLTNYEEMHGSNKG